MLFQSRPVHKSLATFVTFVRFDPQVGLQVSRQVVLLTESLGTVDTGKVATESARLVSRQVLPELMSHLECLLTLRTGHAAQLLAVVCLLVLLELILGEADSATPGTNHLRKHMISHHTCHRPNRLDQAPCAPPDESTTLPCCCAPPHMPDMCAPVLGGAASGAFQQGGTSPQG